MDLGLPERQQMNPQISRRALVLGAPLLTLGAIPGSHKLFSQAISRAGADTPPVIEYVCPMDPDILGTERSGNLSALRNEIDSRGRREDRISLGATVPDHPIAGQKTLIFVHLAPNDGIENYPGACPHARCK